MEETATDRQPLLSRWLSPRQWAVTTKLLVLLAVPFCGLVVLAVAAYRTLSLVQINGPIYGRVADGRDLIADVLPPPQFIIESSLLVFEAMDDLDAAGSAARLSPRLATLESAFEARQRYWREKLPAGSLRDALLNDAGGAARTFFTTARTQFLPALGRGDRPAAQSVIDGPLTTAFRRHREAVDRVVTLTRADNQTHERWAGDETRRASLAMIGIAAATLLVSALAAILLGRSFNRMARAIETHNEALAASNAELQRANNELEAFSYSVSHDLRTPLRAVLGFTTVLTEDFGAQLPAEARRQLDVIANNARHMGQLIDDLLRFARSWQLALRRQTVDMDAVVHICLDELAPLQSGRDVRVQVAPLPPCDADPALVKQVVLNLLSNAFKFTKGRAPAVVEVSARRESDQVVYVVKDNGEGFDMQYAEKVFVVFQRLHAQEDFEGTGVGLALVHRIVSRHGGRIWVDAAPGVGATFSFTLGGTPGSTAEGARA